MEIDDNKDELFEAKRLFSIKDYSAAIKVLEDLENKKILHPKVLVLKYFCMSLMEEDVFTLDDSENVLKQALKLDSDYLPAILEMAYLRLNVLDTPTKAIHLFESATEMLKPLVTEAILGHAQCIAELKGSQEAIAFIKEQQENLISPVKLKDFMDEVNMFGS